MASCAASAGSISPEVIAAIACGTGSSPSVAPTSTPCPCVIPHRRNVPTLPARASSTGAGYSSSNGTLRSTPAGSVRHASTNRVGSSGVPDRVGNLPSGADPRESR